MQIGPFTQRQTEPDKGYKIKDLKSLSFWLLLISVTIGSEAACSKLAPHLPFRPLLSATLCAAIPSVVISSALLLLLTRSDPRRSYAFACVWGSGPAAFRMALWDMGRHDLDNGLSIFVSTTLVFAIMGVITWRCGGFNISELNSAQSQVPANDSQKSGLQ
jgi:hypothetical protein